MNHGTKAAIYAGCECDGCRLMALVYSRHGKLGPPRVSPAYGGPLVDAAPWTEIIRALTAQGHSVSAIARHTGVSTTNCYAIWHGKARVQQSTVDQLRRALDLLPREVSA